MVQFRQAELSEICRSAEAGGWYAGLTTIPTVKTNQADIIVPRGIENKVAIDMVVQHVKMILVGKSKKHQEDLRRLGKEVEDEPLSENVLVLQETPQIRAMGTIIQNPFTPEVEFIFYFDRLATLLVER